MPDVRCGVQGGETDDGAVAVGDGAAQVGRVEDGPEFRRGGPGTAGRGQFGGAEQRGQGGFVGGGRGAERHGGHPMRVAARPVSEEACPPGLIHQLLPETANSSAVRGPTGAQRPHHRQPHLPPRIAQDDRPSIAPHPPIIQNQP